MLFLRKTNDIVYDSETLILYPYTNLFSIAGPQENLTTHYYQDFFQIRQNIAQVNGPRLNFNILRQKKLLGPKGSRIMPRQVLGIRWSDFVSNVDVQARTGLAPLGEILAARRISVFDNLYSPMHGRFLDTLPGLTARQ